MKNRLLLVVLWLCSWVGASAQTIVKAEYFVDTDPGINAATDVAITAGVSISNVTFNTSLTSLSAGMHNLYFRVKDSNGSWSTTERTPFYNLAPITVPAAVNITNAEYFIDTDPGIGAATAITITAGLAISNLTLPISVTSLTEGSHRLFVRFKDANGRWSTTESTLFYKLTTTPPPAAANITNAEYFIDTDPGIGVATAITITPVLAVTDLAVVVNVSSLTEGNHKLFVRFKDANNKWSVSEPTAFSVCNQIAPVAAAATVVSTTGFTANWAAASGATSYRLDVSADNFTTFVSGNNDRTVTGATTATVTGLTIGTAYKYRVRAVNATCASISSAAIDVSTLFTSPSATAATSITTSGFTANWNAVTNATGYRLDISTDDFATFVTNYNNKTVTATNDVVTGLTSATAYKYRVRAVNASGAISGNSTLISVTTSTAIAAPVANAATVITATGFTANWLVVSGATGYRLDVSGDNFATFVTGFSDKAITTVNDVVTGLTAATAYKYRVRAVNANGTSVNSNVIDVTTSAAGTAPAAPVAIAATVISSTGFTANWNTVTGATGYQLDISTDNFATFVTGYNSKSVTAITEVVTGLAAITAYKYRVRATNASGTSASSNVIDATTGATGTAPTTPVAIAATTISSTGFTANWNAVTGATGYQLDISTDNFATFVTGYNSKSITNITEVVTGLTASTAYKYRIRATNASGTSASSNVIDVTTGVAGTAPTTPVAIAATTISSAGFTANWNTVTGATGYQLDISTDNFATFVTGYNSKSVTAITEVVTGLTASTAYKYRVRATNASGTSASSNVIDVTTSSGTKQNQTITFAAISDKTLGSAAFALTATASSALSVGYATTSDKITISSSQVTLVKAGRATITASQAGDATFNAATSVDQSFCIKPAKPTITVSGANTEAITLTSSSATGNQWHKDGTAISGATNATLSVTTVGVYKLQIKVDDCLSEFSADTPFIITGDLSTQSNGITIYPNPVEDYLEVRGLKGEISTSQLADMTGKINTLTLEQKSSVHSANVQHLAAGVYLLRVQQGNSIYQIKFIKK